MLYFTTLETGTFNTLKKMNLQPDNNSIISSPPKPNQSMEGTLCLVPGTHPKLSFQFSPKIHLNFNRYSSLSFPNCYPKCRFGHSVSPWPRALDSSSTHPGDKNGENKGVRGAIGASIAFACAVSIISFGWQMSPKAIAAGPRLIYQKSPSISESIPTFGKMALGSLLEVVVNMSSSKLQPPDGKILDRMPKLPSKQDVDSIKMEAIRLMKYGKPAEAEELLQKAFRAYKNEPEPAYNVEMALVEILICQGKYREALNHKCLQDDQTPVSDHRHVLYKAIIYTMLDKNREAMRLWKTFGSSVGGMGPPFPTD